MALYLYYIFIGVAASVLCMNPYSISSASEARQQVLLGRARVPASNSNLYVLHARAGEERQVKKEDTWEGSRALLLPEGREGGKSV